MFIGVLTLGFTSHAGELRAGMDFHPKAEKKAGMVLSENDGADNWGQVKKCPCLSFHHKDHKGFRKGRKVSDFLNRR
jgi:hypothetical protein